MQGFKSFPDKTVLRFDAAITAIVGPNGSGKSNISDGIRWVMGEQSIRALRGGKMEDIIFGGTETCRGQGFTQVSLSLDNEDGQLPVEDSEVVVTRRYYRSGESEYYINNQLVRLRDIHELFMDTGLGQEGYALIGQGKIDEILSVKSTQRREIFEEAAGISRFRHRKEEAERKLERTEENLLRIMDKLDELELQVEPLREQAEKAKRYVLSRDRLRLLEISLWMDQLDRLSEQEAGLDEAHALINLQLDEVRRETEAMYEESERLSKAILLKEEEIERARRKAGELEHACGAADHDMSVLRVRMEHNKENAARLEEELLSRSQQDKSLSEQTQEQKEALRSRKEESESLRKQQEVLGAQIEDLTEKIQETEQVLKSLKDRQTETLLHRQQTHSLVLSLETSVQEIGERVESLREDLDGMSDQRTEAERLSASLTKEYEDLAQRREDELAAQQRRTEDRIRYAQREQEAGEEKTALAMELHALDSRIRLLEEMEKLYEGYSKAVKTVMEAAEGGRLQGIHGPVGGLFHVDKTYALAVETALGGALQHLIVDDEQSAKETFSYLKKRNAGRVTCLPLSAVRGAGLKEEGFSKQEGFLGIASSLVQCEERYRSVVSSLLGRIAVVRNLDHGIAMARHYGYRFRIVTLDGQVLSPGGAMTGGSSGKKVGILSRTKELEALKEQQRSLTARKEEAELLWERAKEALFSAQSKEKRGEESLRELEHALLRRKEKRESQWEQEEELQKRVLRIQTEIDRLERRAEENQKRIEEEKKRIQKGKEGEALSSRDCATVEAQQSELREKRERLETRRGEIGTRLAVMESEERVAEQACAELCRRMEESAKESARKKGERTRIQGELETLSLRCEEVAEQKEGLSRKVEACQETLGRLSREKLDLEAMRHKAERESRGKNEALLNCQKEAALLEQRKLSSQQEKSSILDKMWEHYEVAHEMGLSLRVPLESRGQAEKEVLSLKNEIRMLGTVNLGAVEEFERVSERYQFLKEQQQDIEESGVQLVRIIEEITVEMKRIFRREFVRINEAFQESFLELFGGGRGSLSLEDEEDILNCGIEIRVQPPGKQLKHLNLLSGGEKAFVAIALYFAILKIRPTPFCVLDEIEAALDDANVLRFARYLRRMSESTQFIVITHRRGTMEEADALYGVTMEKQGVSRILWLNLNDAEKVLDGKAI